jgi:hypothetical protein
MLGFGITPIYPTIPSDPPEFAEFIQFQSGGEDLSGPTVQIVNFLSPIKATRGVGENAHVITVAGPVSLVVSLTGVGAEGDVGSVTASSSTFTLVWDHSTAPKADFRYRSVAGSELIDLVGHFSILELPYDISTGPLGAPVAHAMVWTITTINDSPGETHPFFPYAVTLPSGSSANGIAANASHSQGAVYNAVDNGYGMVNFKQITVQISVTLDGTAAANTLQVVMTPDTIGTDTPGTAVFSVL